MTTAEVKMGRMNRQRDKEPDKRTLEGQVMLYVAHLMSAKGITAADIAEAIGTHRATVFRWLRGDGSPTLADLTPIAKRLGLKDGRQLIPPKSFTEKL